MSILRSAAFVKFTIFIIVMAFASTFLYMGFIQVQAGGAKSYSAVFTDASDLRSGESVRVSGIRVGTVTGVQLGDDQHVTVSFDVDDSVQLTTGTRAVIRYQNLVGDRYLALLDGPGPIQMLPAGSTIPSDRTAPALDLDLLLGGLKPVVQSLDPHEVNALTGSLLQIVQGQDTTLDSLFSKTTSFTTDLADHGEVVQQLIDNLRDVMATVGQDGAKFSAAIDRLQQLVGSLSHDAEPIGSAIDALDKGTASVADLLANVRLPLAGAVDQLARVAPNLDMHKDYVDGALQKAPENFRKLARIGSYGSFINYYLCDLTLRVNDPSGKVLVLPWVHSDAGRCRE
ncbi:phospholipid/cholesterol/gamma-HCH transport system substrate-binding protein [Mycolicibacterium sp. BK634]|uniref:MCE family protein n=1 Tax=Mycolicibacterium sp. BK634 TaxID=2587099 RepID=UPI000D35FF28|nr:MCE family protein [Mycolicibacterium sp. BK634]MBB3753836.1 phospholipid/cholesterol/gamma-HCH transport system substrate-binding protein [Mycolicibacterium sp. BK634]